MNTGRRVLYILLTLYKSALAVDEVTPYHVDAINYMFNLPSWKNLPQYDGFKIVVQRPEEGTESILSAKDILKAVDEGGQIVTGENASSKIHQAHQLFSCQYASTLKLCYHYNVMAVSECENIDDASRSLECIKMFLGMVEKIDEIVVRMLGTLSCIYEVFPITTYDKQVFEAMEDFKRFYGTLYFERTSTDKNYHNSITNSYSKNMNTALNSLVKFYNGFCRPNEDDAIASITQRVQETDKSYVMQLIENRIDFIVNACVKDFWVSVGFEYDTVLKTVRFTYHP